MIEGWFGLGKSDGETSSGRDHEGGVAMVDCLPANRAKTLGVNGNVIEYRIAMPYDLHAAEKGKKFAVASISQDEDDGGGNRAVELVYAETRRHPTLGIVGHELLEAFGRGNGKRNQAFLHPSWRQLLAREILWMSSICSTYPLQGIHPRMQRPFYFEWIEWR